VWKLSRRDFVGDFEAEPEIGWHLIRESLKVLATRKGIIGCIDANRLKDFGIFSQAITLEPCLCNLAAILVPGRRVELTEPAVVFPRRRANEHTLGGKVRS